MARRVFFSFHFQNDIWRVNVVRNSWVTRSGGDAVPFYDNSLWEEAKRKGDAAIKRLIDDGMSGAGVTAVLIGSETASRRYVQYEIEQSYRLGKGLLGVQIHGIADREQRTCGRGANPFDNFTLQDGRSLSAVVPVYDWNQHDGYNNFAGWIESAAQAAGR
jgi:hypothetical protein